MHAPPTLGVGLLLQPSLSCAGTRPLRLPALKRYKIIRFTTIVNHPHPPTICFPPVENEIEYTLFQISTSTLKMIHFDSPTDLVAKIMKTRCLIQYCAALQLMHNFSDFKYILKNSLCKGNQRFFHKCIFFEAFF